jgi:hypothetical protein
VPSPIPERQNEPRSLARLAAGGHLYTVAKRGQLARIGLVVALAAASPVLFLWNEDLAEMVAIAGAVTLVAETICRAYEGQLVARAVRVQDCFDCYVLGLPWNEYLAGDEPSHELVNEAAAKFNGNRDYHRDWYTITEDVDRPYDVLISQRQNLVWDSRLRKAFATVLVFAWIVWFVVEVVIGVAIDISLSNFLLVFVVPGLPAFIAGIELTLSNWRTAQIRDQLVSMWNRVWRRALVDPTAVNQSELRQIQDAIYVCRTRTTQVPNWLQKLKRSKYEADSDASLDHFKRQIAEAGIGTAVGATDG